MQNQQENASFLHKVEPDDGFHPKRGRKTPSLGNLPAEGLELPSQVMGQLGAGLLCLFRAHITTHGPLSRQSIEPGLLRNQVQQLPGEIRQHRPPLSLHLQGKVDGFNPRHWTCHGPPAHPNPMGCWHPITSLSLQLQNLGFFPVEGVTIKLTIPVATRAGNRLLLLTEFLVDQVGGRGFHPI